jgi:radical SAM-linked protein
MAYSSGFHPHPRISYAGASPTGAASEAEYLEIGLAEQVDPADVARALDEALPDGLDVLEVVAARSGSLADRLEASRWQLDLGGAEPGPVGESVTAFLAAPTVTVERMTKKGLRTFDSRAAVLSLVATPYDGGVRLEAVLRHAEPAVRPDDVLSGLASVGGLVLAGPPLVTRLSQGPLVGSAQPAEMIGDPLTG